MRFPNGFLIQYGYYGGNSSAATITLPVSFSNTNYFVSVIQTTTNNGASNTHANRVRNLTKVNFAKYTDAPNCYWFACGY